MSLAAKLRLRVAGGPGSGPKKQVDKEGITHYNGEKGHYSVKPEVMTIPGAEGVTAYHVSLHKLDGTQVRVDTHVNKIDAHGQAKARASGKIWRPTSLKELL